MIRIILGLGAIGILIYVLSLHWKAEQRASITLPVTKMKTDSHVIDSLRQQLQKTCDSLNSYKPAIQKAIQKLRFYDSMFAQHKPIDTLWIKRMRSDLFEARMEIRRLCEPSYYEWHWRP